MTINWIGPGSLPYRTDIEYRFSSWPESHPWATTQVKYVSDSLIVLDDSGQDAPYGPDSMSRMIFRPVGGVFVSEYEEFLRDVVGVVEATRNEKYFLWKEYHFDSKKFTWEAGTSGPVVTVGKLDGRPCSISLLVDVVDGKRILFLDPTSQVVDWDLIDKWLERNMPASAYREGSQYINRTDAGNFYNIIR